MCEHAIGNFILAGPRTPYWGCKCGSDSNYASRIKCRCGASAPTSMLQKAKRNEAATKSQPRASPKSKPRDSNGGEVAKLRAEVAKLREAAKTVVVDVETVEDEEPAVGPVAVAG